MTVSTVTVTSSQIQITVLLRKTWHLAANWSWMTRQRQHIKVWNRSNDTILTKYSSTITNRTHQAKRRWSRAAALAAETVQHHRADDGTCGAAAARQNAPALTQTSPQSTRYRSAAVHLCAPAEPSTSGLPNCGHQSSYSFGWSCLSEWQAASTVNKQSNSFSCKSFIICSFFALNRFSSM